MKVISRKKRTYWLLQFMGWTGYAMIGVWINAMFQGFAIKTTLLSISGATILLLFSHGLRVYAKKNDWSRLHPGKLFLRLLLSTFILALLSQLIVSGLMIWVFDLLGDSTYSVAVLFVYVFQTQIILICWALIYFSYQAFLNYKHSEIEKWKLEAAVKDAELIALKAQINPHFIFNCLNNIRTLVLEDAQKSRNMITKMSELLRYSIQFNHVETVELETELLIVDHYLELQSIQHEDRLRYTIQVDADLGKTKIPPMAIQLLVENAIKHGIEANVDGGSIDVTAKESEGALNISVTNSGQLRKNDKPNPSHTGIGLQNIGKRLKLLFGEKAHLTLQNKNQTMVEAMVLIPLKQK